MRRWRTGRTTRSWRARSPSHQPHDGSCGRNVVHGRADLVRPDRALSVDGSGSSGCFARVCSSASASNDLGCRPGHAPRGCLCGFALWAAAERDCWPVVGFVWSGASRHRLGFDVRRSSSLACEVGRGVRQNSVAQVGDHKLVEDLCMERSGNRCFVVAELGGRRRDDLGRPFRE